MKRILFFEPVAQIGGAEKVLLSLLDRLDRRRFAPAVACLGRGPLVEAVARRNTPCWTYPSHRMREIPIAAGAVAWLAILARKIGAEVIHAQGLKAQIYAGLASRLTRARSLWHLYDPPQEGMSGFDRLAPHVPCDRIVAISPVSRDGIEPHAGTTPIDLIFPGVETPPAPEPDRREAVRRRWGIDPDEFLVINVGRLQEFKGHRHLLGALSILASEGLPVRLLVVGDTLFGLEPDYPARIDAWIAERGLAGRARRTGFLSDEEVFDLYHAADALAHTALGEPFGLVVAEAMIRETPPVVFAADGPRLLVEDAASGFVVEIGDETALADRLRRLATDPALADRLGRAARRRIVERFSVEAMVEAFEAIYEEF